MMPRSKPPRPSDAKALACLAVARQDDIDWETFHKRACGKDWWSRLSTAFHGRCVYCDHCPAYSTDHVAPKSRESDLRFEWDNWRAACLNCNTLKGTKRVFDPVRDDPRRGLAFDLDSGAMRSRDGARGRVLDRAKATLSLGLDHQVINDARRKVKIEFVDMLVSYLEDETTLDDVLAYLTNEAHPHRAILRDLILDHDGIGDHATIVQEALRCAPALRDWAKRPLKPAARACTPPRRRAPRPETRAAPARR
jgi:hypothetical protein